MKNMKTIFTLYMMVTIAFAQWPTSPDSAIHVGFGRQKQVVEDGQGGVYIGSGSYCTRLNHEGEKVFDQLPLDGDYPQKSVNSVALSTDGSLIVSYSNIIFIGSNETGEAHILVQKISPNGVKLWGEGVVVTPDNTTGTYDQGVHGVSSKVIADDSGGAYVAWTDWRNDLPGVSELYIQRLNASGEIMLDSLGVFIDDRIKAFRELVGTSNHLPVLFYARLNTSFVTKVYFQRLTSTGELHWDDQAPQIIGGGYGFSIDAFDNIFFAHDDRIFKHDLDFQPIWPDTGVVISDSSEFIWGMIPDENGGAIGQYQKDTESNRVYSQWVESDGSLKFDEHVLYVSNSKIEYITSNISDSESFIVTYQDWDNYRTQRIDSEGNSLWTDDNLLFNYTHYTSHWQQSISDTEGGIICVLDYNYAIYATQMGPAGNVGSITSIVEPKHIPLTHIPISAYPNPFNPSTTIEYELPEHSVVSLVIFDVAGREVTTLVYSQQTPGSYKVGWNGTNTVGQQVAGGIYFARLKAEEFSNTAKLVYLK